MTLYYCILNAVYMVLLLGFSFLSFYTVFALMVFGLSLYSFLRRNHLQFIFHVASFPKVCSVGSDCGLACAGGVYHIYSFPFY